MTKKNELIPTPDAPLEERVRAALWLVIMMPILFLMTALVFFVAWIVISFSCLLMVCVIPFLPIAALVGMEPEEDDEEL